MKNVQFDIDPILMRELLHLPDRCEVLQIGFVLQIGSVMYPRPLVRVVVRDPEVPDSDRIHKAHPTFTTKNEYRQEQVTYPGGTPGTILVPRPTIVLADWGIQQGT
jgi:hypothetical protein